MKQILLLKNQKKAFGGELMKTRKGRLGPRPIVTTLSTHMVLRSSKAIGEWSFRLPKNAAKIEAIVERFTIKYGVKVYSFANVGNHLHFHLKFGNRYAYKPFIRAITAAIAMAITGASRWKPLKKAAKDRFWDYRPFTRVVESFRAFMTLKDYIEINQWEGKGYRRSQARLFIVAKEFKRLKFWSTG